MPRYDVRVAALALDVPYRWLDTLLARHDIAGVTSEAQGVRRSLTEESLFVLTLVRDLHHHLGLPLGRAVDTAHRLQAAGMLELGTLRLQLSPDRMRGDIARDLTDALERVVPRRRGRPPRRPTA